MSHQNNFNFQKYNYIFQGQPNLIKAPIIKDLCNKLVNLQNLYDLRLNLQL